jgi:uncharacterized repeat protein (TIGR01451 family)
MNSRRFALVMAAGVSGTLTVILLWMLSIPGSQATAMPAPPLSNAPAPRYVCITGTNSGDCTDSRSPCRTVQYAVDQASEGSVIKVASGTYTGVEARPRNDVYSGGIVTQVVHITKSITIQGGYTTTDRFAGPPDPVANPTTLDAQGQGRVIYIGRAASVTVTGLHITGGDATGLAGGQYHRDAGGGVYVVSGTATLNNNAVFGNVARDGGGVGAVEASVTISGGQVFSNAANGRGGGVYVINDSEYSDYGTDVISITVSLLNNQVFCNTAGDSGGGVFVDNAAGPYEDSLGTVTALFSGNRVFDNTAEQGEGGGLCLFDSTAVLTSNIVTTNTATSGGGGLSVSRWLFYWRDSVPPRLSGNIFRANRAGWAGGGLYLGAYQYAMLSSNVIVSNSADYGGGLFAHFGGGTFTNTVVTDNQADTAGSGLCFVGSWSRLLHTTVARNYGGDGSGICLTWYSSGSILIPNRVTLTNTIVASQTVGITMTGYGAWPGGSAATLDGILWFSNETNIVTTDPTTVTQVSFITVTGAYTGDPAFAADGYHLKANSAAIDRGTCVGVATDVDGQPRPSRWGCDLGADEFPAALRVTKRASPDPVPPGAQLTYTISVANTGNKHLHATITDTLPLSVTLEEASGGTLILPGGTLSRPDGTVVLPDGRVAVVWTDVTTAPDGVWRGTIVVTVNKGYVGPLTNLVEVTTKEGAAGEGSVTVNAGRPIYLPLVMREFS